MTRVKVCGLCSPVDAEAAVAAGAELLGFIFVAATPRFLDPREAHWVREIKGAETVGVFRDAPLAQMLELRKRLELDWVQLHGEEPDDYLTSFGPQVLRRVPTRGGVSWQRVRELGKRCLPLLDPGAGSGETCDWQELAARPHDVEIALAGGLDAQNVSQAVRLVRPVLVDVSSGVEKAPRRKCAAAMRDFVAATRAL